MCCKIFSSRNGRPESFNFAEKKEEMLDPAEIPFRLEQALSYLSSNNQIYEHFAVPDCACFLFNTRDANYEQDQHHVKLVNADKKGCLVGASAIFTVPPPNQSLTVALFRTTHCYTITRLPFVSRWQCLILASHHSDSLQQ